MCLVKICLVGYESSSTQALLNQIGGVSGCWAKEGLAQLRYGSTIILVMIWYVDTCFRLES